MRGVTTEVRPAPDIDGLTADELTSDELTSDELMTSELTTSDVLTQLLRAAGRVAGEQSRHLRRLGLSPSAFAVLLELTTAAPDGLQPCDLAARLSISRPSVCGLIDGLEAKSLVERRPHQHDGRRVLVTLSAGGTGLLETHRERYERCLDTLVAELTPSERDELFRLLECIAR